ncbi:SirA family protein [Moraxella macacae 0408225]|uniref:SirA family protein n=1 Tax=Moraxella macacae 0408225 TaxID=1230338 RepID=L2F824_9GAMM|nr:sulfurtransferase TusA family protein [Moraxella macacae]ELA08598.1 SirA family protein [Moraxella macacae 0408225]
MNLSISQHLQNLADFQHDWQMFAINLPNLGMDHLPTNLLPTNPLHIEQYVNGKNLTCPMPLLKLKMALKISTIGNAVYLTATDPNSTHDILAFCRHAGHMCYSTSVIDGKTCVIDGKVGNDKCEIFNFLIVKNS